jgi:hypothetical protein
MRGTGVRIHDAEAKEQTSVNPDDLAFARPRSLKILCSTESWIGCF